MTASGRAAWYGLADRIEATRDGSISHSDSDLAVGIGEVIEAADRLDLEKVGHLLDDPETWQQTLASAEWAVAVEHRARDLDRGVGLEL